MPAFAYSEPITDAPSTLMISIHALMSCSNGPNIVMDPMNTLTHAPTDMSRSHLPSPSTPTTLSYQSAYHNSNLSSEDQTPYLSLME